MPKPPIYFASPAEWRDWLHRHHATESELLVGFHKVGSGRPSMTWPQSVDEALCYGWIDGRRTGVDETRYMIRFTPRRATSTWSAVNIRRVGELEAEGRMQPAGRAAFARRKESRSETYSYERRPESFDEPLLSTFRKARRAFRFFEAQPPSYRRAVISWVSSARQEGTRLKRLAQLIADSAEGRWLAQMAKYRKPRTSAAKPARATPVRATPVRATPAGMPSTAARSQKATKTKKAR
ncbi:MAG TPA: YdeI/OmpD-associated family protein [Gemmatimonadaceae bacterium]|nr:YdeI/OmpD-associated family protein [Gemmatimonadaceae bacterium]